EVGRVSVVDHVVVRRVRNDSEHGVVPVRQRGRRCPAEPARPAAAGFLEDLLQSVQTWFSDARPRSWAGPKAGLEVVELEGHFAFVREDVIYLYPGPLPIGVAAERPQSRSPR